MQFIIILQITNIEGVTLLIGTIYINFLVIRNIYKPCLTTFIMENELTKEQEDFILLREDE